MKYILRKDIFDLDKQKFAIKDEIPFGGSDVHKHDFFQIGYVFSGEFVQLINDEKVTFTESSLFVMNKNVEHSISENKDDLKVLFIGINEDIFDKSFFELTVDESIIIQYLKKSISDDDGFRGYISIKLHSREIANILMDMHNEFLLKDYGFEENIKLNLMLLINKAHKLESAKSLKNKGLAYDRVRINNIFKYLNKNYADASLENTAKYINVHSSYLSKIIKEQTGINFTAILREIKIKKACYLLISTDLSIENISKEVGYENPNYFYKVFRVLKGVTPNQYRKNNRI